MGLLRLDNRHALPCGPWSWELTCLVGLALIGHQCCHPSPRVSTYNELLSSGVRVAGNQNQLLENIQKGSQPIPIPLSLLFLLLLILFLAAPW